MTIIHVDADELQNFEGIKESLNVILMKAKENNNYVIILVRDHQIMSDDDNSSDDSFDEDLIASIETKDKVLSQHYGLFY